MSGSSLVESIVSSDDKNHTLLSWATLKLEKVNETKECENDTQSDFFLEIHNQLVAFVRYNAELLDEEQVDSHYIFLTLSQLCSLCLLRLEKTRSGKIYDCAELLSKVLLEDAIESEDSGKKKKKKTTRKKTYTRSAAKEMACIMLIQIFETFGDQLSSLAPLLFACIFKNFKKIMEKSKYTHASFTTSLMQLTNVILKHGGRLSFYSDYFSKFTKLSKRVFEAICSEKHEYSIDLVSAIMDTWSNYFCRESFAKDNKGNLENAILTHYSDGELGTLGFANDFSRPVIARTLAEVMFHHCKVSRLLAWEQVLQLYSTLFTRSNTRDVQTGVFESIVHFIGLCSSADENFLQGNRYLEITGFLARSIFSSSRVSKLRMDALSRELRYFDSMHKLLLPRIGESPKNLMVLQLLGSGERTGDLNVNQIAGTNQEFLWLSLAQLDLARHLLADLSSTFGNEKHLVQRIKEKLIELSICENFTLRVHASDVLKVFLSNFPQFLSETIEDSLTALSKSFKQIDEFPFAVNHGHALIIANLIGCADKDYVSFELIMKITVFATSFIKNHTTTTTTPLYSKSLLCWILLIGCMSYKDDRYLQMQSSQLFLFWKVLLTHSYSVREEDELYRNLEIRNHALTCLLTFLGNESIGSKIVAKQVSYLLTKCSTFNHSITQKSAKIDKALLTNELRLLQIHLRLHRYIKDDFNSSLLILIMKNFSDPNLYSESTHSLMDSLVSATDSKNGTNADQLQNIGEPSVATILRQNDGFAFGMTSKISPSNLAELHIRKKTEIKQDTIDRLKGCSWNLEFENEVTKPISPMLSLDYFVTLYCPEGYSSFDKFSPKITTALIDASMEVFSLKFPYLNDKIQYSIIENLNSSMFCRTTSPLRNVAIAANVLISVNKALEVMLDNGLQLSLSVSELLLKSIDRLKFDNDYCLLEMKAKCVGLICGTMNRFCTDEGSDAFTEQVNLLIKGLIEVEEPFMRIFRVLSLVNIYRFCPSGMSFTKIFDIVSALIKDPHPVVHCWSLKAMSILIEKHSAMDHATASSLVKSLEDVSVSPSYGMYGASVLRYNYCMEFEVRSIIGQILKSLTEIFGPCISELPEKVRVRFRSLTYGLAVSNNIGHQSLAVEIYTNMVVFRNQNTLNDQFFIDLAKSIINSAIIIGFGSTYFNCHLTKKVDVISSTSSPSNVMQCFDLFSLLTKMQKGALFAHDLDIASWRWLFLSPSSKSVKNYLLTWMEQTPEDEIRLFDRLYLIFNIGQWRLFSGYYRSLIDLLKKSGLEAAPESEIPSEEEKSIAQTTALDKSQESQNSSDSIPWRSRLFLLSMINQLCNKSIRSEGLSSLLSHQIPELVRLSFQASTSNVAALKAQGLDILRLVLKSNSSLSDRRDSGPSELKQQEAQIVSAMMPAFGSGTPPDIVVSAIDLSAEILTSGVSSMQKLERVTQLLIEFLGIFNDSKPSVKLGDVLIVTQKSKKKIELSILSAWAELVQYSVIPGGEDLRKFTENYWDILVPLWIMSLREYAMVKYEGKPMTESSKSEVKEPFHDSEENKSELPEGAWLNMVIALTSVLETSPQVVLQRLNETETESFMLILFIQCIEIVVKSVDDHDTLNKVLPALYNVLSCCVPLDALFEDGTNEELVSILDRLMSTGNNREKIVLVRIIDKLVTRYIKKNDTHESFLQGIDKLYELLRLLLKPISQILPFIRYNTIETEELIRPNLNVSEMSLLKESFSALESNVDKFGDLFKVDLYSCLLFIIGEIFECDDREVVIPVVLPLLKSISESMTGGEMNDSLLRIFYDSVRALIFEKIKPKNQLAICFILLTNGFSHFTQNDLDRIVAIILEGLRDQETRAISMHGLTSLVNKGLNQISSCYVVKNVILEISKHISNEHSEVADPFLEFVRAFVSKVYDTKPGSSSAAVALMLSLEVSYVEKDGKSDEKAANRVMSLIAMDKEAFKIAVNSLNEEQRTCLGQIMEKSSKLRNGRKTDSKSDLLLKSFV